MANNFLILGMIAAFGWAFVSSLSPRTQPTAQLPASPAAAAGPSATSFTTASPIPEVRQAPVPLVRSVRVSPLSAPPTQGPATMPAEPPPQVNSDRRARAAVEADGYKRVTIL